MYLGYKLGYIIFCALPYPYISILFLHLQPNDVVCMVHYAHLVCLCISNLNLFFTHKHFLHLVLHYSVKVLVWWGFCFKLILTVKNREVLFLVFKISVDFSNDISKQRECTVCIVNFTNDKSCTFFFK